MTTDRQSVKQTAKQRLADKWPAHQIRVGNCYVREQLDMIRKIVNVPFAQYDDCFYEEYKLSTGSFWDSGTHACSKFRVLDWADREATPEERARMQRPPSRQEIMLEQALKWGRASALRDLSDEDLLAEAERRGLLVGKETSHGE